MKKILCLLFLILGLSMISCKKVETSPAPTPTPTPTPTPQKQEFVATIPNTVTKTTVTENGKVTWLSTDVIGVYDEGVVTPVKATVKSISEDGKTAVFVVSSEVKKATGAIYPYDANAYANGNVASVVIKATQSGNFADANISAATSSGNNLTFKNATAVFKFKVSDENIRSVKLKAAGIAGTLQITFGSSISSVMSGETASNEISVSAINPGSDYYVVVAPKVYDNLQFIWFDNTGAVLGSASFAKNLTVRDGELFAWGDLEEHKDVINYVDFEDANFKAYCVENFDTDGDDEISLDEAAVVTCINVNSKGLSSLAGIENFPNLTSLNCSNNQLTNIDLSNNLNLETLSCNSNQLSGLDVSKNIKLLDLSCNNNMISSLDISNNTNLKNLSCGSNLLDELDVSKNTALTSLSCQENQLTNLDVSNNTVLTSLVCADNQLTSLDVSINTNLSTLDCSRNQLTEIYVWEGFDETTFETLEKDNDGQFLVKKNGGTEDYTVKDPWDDSIEEGGSEGTGQGELI